MNISFTYLFFLNFITWPRSNSGEPLLEKDKPNIIPFIVSGQPANNHELAKYLVQIAVNRWTPYFGANHICGGVIIARDVILTAAHCLVNKNKTPVWPHQLYIVAGSRNRFLRTKTTQRFDIESIIVHENYRRFGISDIGIIYLREKIPTWNEGADVIQMADSPPKAGAKCTTLGWGRLFWHGPQPANIMFVDIYIIEQETCQKLHENLFRQGMLCAGDTGDWYKDSCSGDSGGPLICDQKLVGIVSWGRFCGTDYSPGVYTDVWYHRSWIEENGGQKIVRITKSECLAWILMLMFVREFLKYD